jgi:hypothetical protein
MFIRVTLPRTTLVRPIRRQLMYALIVLIGLFRLTRTFPQQAELRSDFGLFVASGLSLRAGENPYVIDPRLVPELQNYEPMLSAPAILPYASLLSAIDPLTGIRLVIGLSCLAYALVCSVLLGRMRADRRLVGAAWLATIDCFWTTIQAGQIEVFLAVIVVAAWMLLPRHPTVGGLVFGLVIGIKPNLVLWAVMLLAAGYWTPAVTSTLSAGVVSAIPAVMYGHNVYGEWLTYAIQGDHPSYWFFFNGAISAVFSRIGWPIVGTIASAAVVAGLILLVVARRPPIQQVSELAIVTSIFASPIAWPAYLLLVLPTFTRLRLHPLVLGAGALMCFPLMSLFQALPVPTALSIIGVLVPLIYALLLVGSVFQTVHTSGGPPGTRD